MKELFGCHDTSPRPPLTASNPTEEGSRRPDYVYSCFDYSSVLGLPRSSKAFTLGQKSSLAPSREVFGSGGRACELLLRSQAPLPFLPACRGRCRFEHGFPPAREPLTRDAGRSGTPLGTIPPRRGGSPECRGENWASGAGTATSMILILPLPGLTIICITLILLQLLPSAWTLWREQRDQSKRQFKEAPAASSGKRRPRRCNDVRNFDPRRSG